jgi:arsenite-transporting ATPase
VAIAETLDGLEELRQLDVYVDTVVVNRMRSAPEGPCRWCATRRSLERAAIEPLLRRMPRAAVLRVVHERAKEPLGVAALLEIAGEMERRARLGRPASRRIGRLIGQPEIAGDAVALPADLSLLMFGGKGGVGKTTCAAAAAIELAARQPNRSILALSTDPAHSLGDVLGLTLGNKKQSVPGAPPNLRARELDAAAEFERLKAQYHRAIDDFLGRFVRENAIGVTGDRQSLRDLIELAPPGLDELMAIVEVSDTLETGGGRPLLVVDTAPTGHALRLLEMPALVHEWVKALMAILLKYQAIAPVGELGGLLLRMSQGLTRLRALLTDPSRTAFVVVTRPGALPMAEMQRMGGQLRQLKIPVVAVLVNALGAGTCVRCRTTVREQARARAEIRRAKRLVGCAIIGAPAMLPPPTGRAELRAWRSMWRSEPSGISSRTWVGRRRRATGK